MKKFFSKVANKIAEKPFVSMAYVFVCSILLTFTVLLSTDLKNIFVSDGIYAIKSSSMIRLGGDAELPLYKEALKNISDIPSDKDLYIYSGFGKKVPGSDLHDLVYYNGIYKGDFYETSVILMGRRYDSNYYEPQNCGTQFNEDVSEKFSLTDRREMVKLASLKVDRQMKESVR